MECVVLIYIIFSLPVLQLNSSEKESQLVNSIHQEIQLLCQCYYSINYIYNTTISCPQQDKMFLLQFQTKVAGVGYPTAEQVSQYIDMWINDRQTTSSTADDIFPQEGSNFILYLIIGITLGVVLALLAFVGVAIACYKHRRKATSMRLNSFK